MMTWWLEKGIDGLRMDVINFISKDPSFPDGKADSDKEYASGEPYFMNGPKIHDYLKEMNQEVTSKYDIMTVGEMPGVSCDEAILYTSEDRE